MANELFIKHKIIDVTPDLVEDGSIYFERSTNLIKVVESDSSIITVGVKKGTGVNSAILNDLNNIASGENALAQGSNSTASGQCAHAEGSSTQATGEFSHSEGYNTVAAGKYSHAEGYGTETKNEGEHAQGRWNVSSDTPGYETIHTIGYGTGSSNRKNIYELHRTGKQFIIGLGDYDGTNASTAKSVQQVIADLTTLVTANSDLYLIDKVQSGSIDEWIGGWDNVVLAIENKKLFGITDSTNSYNSKNRVIFPAMVDRYPQNVIKWSYLYQDPVADTGYSINTITITKSDDNTLSKQEQSFSLGGDVDSLISVSDSMVQVGNGTDTINLKTYNRPYVNNNEQLAYLSDVEDILEPYTVNLTNLLSAQDSESISTAIGGIDNLNATVTKNQVIFGTLANGTVAVEIRVLGNQTTLTYFVDSLVGLTVNEVIITNTSGTLSKTVNTHSVLTENMVINSLESDETTLPLSAAQGKVLNEKILNSKGVYYIDGRIIDDGEVSSSEQISEAIGGWENLVNAIQNNYIIILRFLGSGNAQTILPGVCTVYGNAINIDYRSGAAILGLSIANQSGTLSAIHHEIELLNTDDYMELQTSNKTILGSINELYTLTTSKADSQDITDAINALDKAEVSTGTGEIISAVSQENGIVNVSKRSLTSDDIPTLPQSKIEDLTDTLAGKQATLVSGTNIKTLNGESLLGSGNISIPVPSSIDVTTLFADTASITSGISTQIAALGNSGVTEFPVLYAGSAIGNIKPTWIRTASGVTNMMCIADNKIWYFEIQGTTVQRAELAIS